MMRAWILAALAFGMSGCQSDEPDMLMLTYGSYASSPVVITEVLVNGAPMPHGPVTATEADLNTPRTGDYNSIGFPPSVQSGQVVVSATWVEVFTKKAWRAEVAGSVSALARSEGSDSAWLGPVFGPNGLMILTSDPIPTSAQDVRQVDLARVCGSRVPDRDFDYTSDETNVWVTDLLQYDFPPVTTAECAAQD